MEEQLISFETAKLAKEKGFPFDEDNTEIDFYTDNYGLCRENSEYHNLYSVTLNKFIQDWDRKYKEGNHYPASTQSLLAKWLREEHKIHINIEPILTKEQTLAFISSWCKLDRTINEVFQCSPLTYKRAGTYEQALELALENALSSI